jgi:hypothetical protein
MNDDLPPLIGPPRDVARAASIRERLVLAMEDAARDGWRQFQRSRSDDWQSLMQAEEEQELAFAAMRAKTDAAWWIARRERTLAWLVREALAALRPEQAGR